MMRLAVRHAKGMASICNGRSDIRHRILVKVAAPAVGHTSGEVKRLKLLAAQLLAAMAYLRAQCAAIARSCTHT